MSYLNVLDESYWVPNGKSFSLAPDAESLLRATADEIRSKPDAKVACLALLEGLRKKHGDRYDALSFRFLEKGKLHSFLFHLEDTPQGTFGPIY